MTSGRYNDPLCSILCVLQPLWARHGQKLQHKRAWRNSNVGPGPPFMVCPLHSRAGRYTHEAILFTARLVGAILYTKATLTFMVVEGVSMEYSKCCCSTVLCTTWYLIHQYISIHTKCDAPWIVHWLYNVPGFPFPGWVRQDCWGVSKHQP